MPKTDNLRKQIKRERRQLLRAAATLAERAGPYPTVVDHDAIELAFERAQELTARLEMLPKSPKVTNVVPVDPYSVGSPYSFVRDSLGLRSPVPPAGLDLGGATARLQAAAELANLRRKTRDELARTEVRARGVEVRALGEFTAGAGGEFVPASQTMLDRFASISRSAAATLSVIPTAPLPDYTSSIIVPKVSASGDVGRGEAENLVPPGMWSATEALTFPVVMFSGQIMLSQQLVDRAPGLDQLVSKDAAESFAQQAEDAVLNAPGGDDDIEGLCNVDGGSSLAFTTSSAAPADVVAGIAQLMALSGNARKRPASHIVMTPERWAWIAGTSDGNGSPVERVGSGWLGETPTPTAPVGPINGLPVLQSGEIAQDQGDDADQDMILSITCGDLLWLASPPVFNVGTEGGLAAQLSAYCEWHCYAAFVGSRYPEGIGVMSGAGLVRPSGWSS